MAPFFLNLPPCMVGIEACGGAHHWARELQALGHIPRLPAAQFVKHYAKTKGNDTVDAEAICEAACRPSSCRTHSISTSMPFTQRLFQCAT